MLNYFEESQIKNSRLPIEWQSQSVLDELSQFLQLNWEQRSAFYDDGEVTSKQQFLTFTGQKGLRTNNYVGTIVFKGHKLNIFPKMFSIEKNDTDTQDLSLAHLMKNLVQWIEYCTKFEYPYMSISSELEDTNDLRELFVTLYIRYVKSALEHGLFYQYEDRTEDCGAIKGRLNISDFFCRKISNGQIDRFQCTYSSFELDNQLNRIIKYTCKLLLNEAKKANQKPLRLILIRMNEVSDIKCIPSDCEKVRLSRRNGSYGVILSMSKMFLLNQTSSYNVDTNESFCFLFPTELLFEGFIGGFITCILHGKAKVKLQASDMSLVSNVVYAGESYGKAFLLKHDILVEHHSKGLFVLDTKYKMVTRFKDNPDIKKSISDDISQSDLYQVREYAAQRGLKDAYLLYPLFRFEDEEPDIPVLEGNIIIDGIKHEINVHIVRLPFVFEDNVEQTKEKLVNTINRIFM